METCLISWKFPNAFFGGWMDPDFEFHFVQNMGANVKELPKKCDISYRNMLGFLGKSADVLLWKGTHEKKNLADFTTC